MKEAVLLLLSFFAPLAMAAETLSFKKPFSPHIGWLNYGLAVVVLLILVWIVAKKRLPVAGRPSACQLIEKKYLGHKTVVYVIEYQQQRFLLADNQQALAIHPLKTGEVDEVL